jgi:antagonist of KipI
MSIKIIKAGILDTVQDLGRYGYQASGINPGGAMDKYALQVANALVGNDPGEAAIEMHFPASVFLFTKPTLIALSGADFSPSINGEPVPLLHPVMVGKNDLLHFQKPASGARAYLAVHGGFALEKWMESYSTNLKAVAGGFKGRALIKEDSIPLRKSIDTNYEGTKVLHWQAAIEKTGDQHELLVLVGHEWDYLTEDAKDNFGMTSFVITQQSDRMGYRLNNIPLPVNTNEELVSSAVSFGTVQLLPDGKLIILAADHQTTGGYPRVAHVVSAYHSKLAQMKAGDKIHFKFTNISTAEKMIIKQNIYLKQLRNSCIFRLGDLFKQK